jgi:hypothetical protein
MACFYCQKNKPTKNIDDDLILYVKDLDETVVLCDDCHNDLRETHQQHQKIVKILKSKDCQ